MRSGCSRSSPTSRPSRAAASSPLTLLTASGPWPEPGEVFPSWEERVARPFRAFCRRNIRTRPVLARWLLPWNWFALETSVLALADQYERHLTGLTLADLPTRPAFIFCATDLSFGVNWEICRESVGDYLAGYASPPPNWSLGRAVAASSCFRRVRPLPVDLQPGQLRNGKMRGPQRDALVTGLKLTDGGVYDNMGLERSGSAPPVVLVSDGGSVFDYESDDDPIRPLMRYLAVFGDQAGRLRKRWLIAEFPGEGDAGDLLGHRQRRRAVRSAQRDGHRTTARLLVSRGRRGDRARPHRHGRLLAGRDRGPGEPRLHAGRRGDPPDLAAVVPEPGEALIRTG